MKNIILSVILVSVFIISGFNSGKHISVSILNQHDTSGFMGIMHKNMMQMEFMKMTGDPDYDFATTIQMHHKGGIEIANLEIKRGSDTATINLAKKIKAEQEKDVKELQKFLSDNKPGKSNTEFVQEMKNHMQKAKSEMNSHMHMSGNIDKDFATLMAMHHKHGQDMAKTEMKYGTNSKLKDFAQKTFNMQESERKQLESFKE